MSTTDLSEGLIGPDDPEDPEVPGGNKGKNKDPSRPQDNRRHRLRPGGAGPEALPVQGERSCPTTAASTPGLVVLLALRGWRSNPSAAD